MKRLIATSALLGSLAMGASGCSALSALASKNPAVVATAFEQAANVADTIATIAWGIAEPLLPAADQAAALAQWAKAQTDYQDALAALNDAVKAYQEGQAADWPALILSVQNAVDAIVAAVDQYGSTQAGSSSVRLSAPAFVTTRADLAQAVATVHRY